MTDIEPSPPPEDASEPTIPVAPGGTASAEYSPVEHLNRLIADLGRSVFSELMGGAHDEKRAKERARYLSAIDKLNQGRPATEQVERALPWPSSAPGHEESAKSWLDTLEKRGRLLVPAADLTESSLSSEVVRILNPSEVNTATKDSVRRLGSRRMDIAELVLEPGGKVLFKGDYLPTSPYITRVLNELLFGYLHEPLHLELLFAKCGFALKIMTVNEARSAKDTLHQVLVVLQTQGVVAYNIRQPHQVTLRPIHITENRPFKPKKVT